MDILILTTIIVATALLYRRIKNDMSDLSDAVALVQQGQADEAARVEAVITLLESNPDKADVQAAIAALKELRGTQDAERPNAPPA